jgi:trigger factor
MRVEVEASDRVTRKVTVSVPEEKVTELRNEIFEELRKQAKIKGFRPGKIPRQIIANYYKEFIIEEVKKRVLETTMADALSEAKVDPIVEPVVEFTGGEGEQGYILECEVMPEIELPEYKGIEVEVDPIDVSDEEVEQRTAHMRDMHAQMVPKEQDQEAGEGDFLIIKYQGYMNGKPVKDMGTEAYPLELGKGNLLPEFEAAVTGMKAGEEKDVPIDFPDNYPDKAVAGKKVMFKVVVREIREKKRPEVDDEFAKDLNFDDLGKLKEGLRAEITKEKEASRRQVVSQRILETLTAAADIPVPVRVKEKRVESMLEEAKTRVNAERFAEGERKAFEEDLRKDFESKAEERIKGEIVMSKIAKQEGFSVSDEEVEERLKRIAEDARRTYDDVKHFYDDYNLLEKMRINILHEKTINFLVDNASIKEKS